MDGTAGRSAGFGRIGGEVRTSLYTPVHLASAPRPVGPVRSPWTPLALSAGLAVVLAAATGLALLLVGRGGPEAPPARVDAGAPSPQVDAEAERLHRSALAQRPRG